MEVDVKKFRHNNPELFWNIIFYMSNYGLPYDMFLPYQDTKEIIHIEKQFEKLNEHCAVSFGEESNVTKILSQKNAKQQTA